MSQSDIYELLKSKLLSGDFRYFRSKDIARMLKEKGNNVSLKSINNNLMKLRCFGYLDTRLEGTKTNRTKYIYVTYRLKKDSLST